MLNSIILLGGFVSAFGLGAISPNQEKQDNVNFRLENHKSVQYDDEVYTITLSADELNNYIFSNLYAYFNGLTNRNDFVSTTMFYNDKTLSLSNLAQYQNASYDWSYQGDTISVYFPLNLGGVYDSEYFNTNTNYTRNFVGEVVWHLNTTVYTSVKQAIELDIQANQPSPNIGQVMVQFVSILTDGIVSLGSGVANGVVSMASALFLEVDDGVVTGLSVFGGILAIFAGLALAIGITTKIYQWVTSLGN